MVNCCVPVCQHSDKNAKKFDHLITFHRFPRDENLKKEWLVKIRRDEGKHFKVNPRTVICSDHFTVDSLFWKIPLIGKRRRFLTPAAVPTLFNWTAEGEQPRLLKRVRASTPDVELETSATLTGDEQSIDRFKMETRICNGDNQSRCETATETFSEIGYLTCNEAKGTDDRYTCNICNRNFVRKGNLSTHLRLHMGDMPYKCNICNQAFAQSCTLRAHFRTHTGEKPYRCNTCGKSFAQKSPLDFHIMTHTGEKPHECNLCDKAFAQKCTLDRHMRTHTGERPYTCSVCNKAYVRKSSLDNHMLTHTSEKLYSRDREFAQSSGFNTHLSTHISEKPYRCSLCNKSFAQSSYLYAHFRTHTGERPYECNLCNKAFAHRCILNKHVRTHTGEKPYKCNLCNLVFAQKFTLNKHIRTHADGKPYKCNVAFAQKSILNRHLRTRTGEEPYKCNLCNIAFPGKSLLNKHTRTHTGGKPFKCNLCNLAFAQRSSLNEHVGTHTGEKRYKCNFCHKVFRSRYAQKGHSRTHTADNSNNFEWSNLRFTHLSDHNYHLNSQVKPYKGVLCQSLLSRMMGRCHGGTPTYLKTPDKCAREESCHIENQCNSNICHKGSAQINMVKENIRAQTGDKPYKSQVCLSTKLKTTERDKENTPSKIFSKYTAADDCFFYELPRIENTQDASSGNTSLWENKFPGLQSSISIDLSPFVVTAYGCAICDEIFEVEKEFIEHCCHHQDVPQEDTLFFNLFGTCTCRETY